jgi:hypothetical protein
MSFSGKFNLENLFKFNKLHYFNESRAGIMQSVTSRRGPWQESGMQMGTIEAG